MQSNEIELNFLILLCFLALCKNQKLSIFMFIAAVYDFIFCLSVVTLL